ncbi:MAG: TonB-dependent receptor [Bacteroidota bacterium]
MFTYLSLLRSLGLGISLLFSLIVYGQTNGVNQTLRGIIFDQSTHQGLEGASVQILHTNPVLGGISDQTGSFVIEGVPVGRYEIQISYIGYKTQRKSSILLSSGQETVLEIGLVEQVVQGDVVLIESDQRKVTNEAALVSARSFSVEELRRIPGGIDDPARMAVKFPGISPNPDALSNELNVRGNSSRSVIWRLEGVDIYNPNHFARVGGTGGSVTLFSQQLLTNTDFFSGAFPADYGNSLGAVFDARFRNGNTQKRQHAFQLSFLGLDASTEGPISSSGNNSYLVNYRYSTTGIIKEFVDVGIAIPTYQDLSFKLHFQLPNSGSLNVFGIGGISQALITPVLDTARWTEEAGLDQGRTDRTTTGTVGMTYSQSLGSKSYFQTALIGTGLKYFREIYFQNRDLITADTTNKSLDFEYRLSWSTYINHKFGPRHTHRTGITAHGLLSNVFLARPDNIFDVDPGGNLNDTLRQGRGQSLLVNAYSRSQFALNNQWQVNVGLHLMYLHLTGEVSVEPRLGIRYQMTPRQSFSFGYGLHSQMEPFYTYIVQQQDQQGALSRINDQLRFNKAHHFVLSYRYQASERLRLGVEAYYQAQFNMVVAKDLPISRVGGEDFFFETFDLDNGGTGRNMGIELALERNFSGGYYFLINGSFFDATYTPNDQITRPSRFNTGMVGNGIIGKEWKLGKKQRTSNLLNVNIAASYTGPQYYTPLNIPLILEEGIFQTDYLNPNSAIQNPLFLLDASIVYQRNLLKRSSQLTLQVRNLLNQRPLLRQTFDRERGESVDIYGAGIIPVFTWKIQL